MWVVFEIVALQSLRHGCAVPPPFTQGRLTNPPPFSYPPRYRGRVLFNAFARRADKVGKQRRSLGTVRRKKLRMPLNGKQVSAGLGSLDRLDRAVVGHCGDSQCIRRALYCLMVKGVGICLCADKPVKARAGGDAYVLRGFAARLLLRVRRDMLIKRSAQRDVYKLDSAADAEYGLAAGINFIPKGKLKGVAGGVYLDAVKLDRLSLMHGVNVHASGKQKAVKS